MENRRKDSLLNFCQTAIDSLVKPANEQQILVRNLQGINLIILTVTRNDLSILLVIFSLSHLNS
jgi:hypothetical protein